MVKVVEGRDGGAEGIDQCWSALRRPLVVGVKHTRPLLCVCVGANSFWPSFNVIRLRVIGSTSLLIVQTKMSVTNGS